MAPNFTNAVLPSGGGLSMLVVVNARMNEARDSLYAAAPAEEATTNMPS